MLLEAATWVSLRDPSQIAPCSNAWPNKTTEHLRVRIRSALNNIADEAISGHITILAQCLVSRKIRKPTQSELLDLEFYIAEEIPGAPFGFRGRVDKIIKWTNPTVAAVDILRRWPPARPLKPRKAAKF